jgi:hypothetical protein
VPKPAREHERDPHRDRQAQRNGGGGQEQVHRPGPR